MTKYTKEQIEETRNYFISQGFPLRETSVGNKDLSFFVLAPELNPDLKNFAFACVGDPLGEKVIGVSAEVPEQFQPYWAFHEATEYVDIGEEVKGRCLMALNRELNVLPVEFKPIYLHVRAQFFRDLVKYAKARPEKYSAEHVAEFEASRDALSKILKGGLA